MSLVCVPLKGQNFKMLTVLHSIALLDSSHAQVRTKLLIKEKITDLGRRKQEALKKRMMPLSGPTKPTLKRRVGYNDNDTTQTKRPHINGMDVE